VPTPDQTVQLALEMGRQGKPEVGIAQLRRFLQRQPNNWMVVSALGQLLMQADQGEQAVFQFRRCLEAAPKNPSCHNNIGMALSAVKRDAEAIAAFREAVRLDPAYAKGWVGLSMALLRVPDYQGAAEAARKAMSLAPEIAESYLNLGLGLLESGQVEESIAALRDGLKQAPWHAAMHSTLLIALNYRDDLSRAQLRAEHEEFGRQHPPTTGTSPARTDPNPGRRLRIGILSSDLRTHSVMYFFEPLLEHHDRSKYEFICFPASTRADETTARLRAQADKWVDAAIPDHSMVDRLIRREKIDILIELGGHSALNRLLSVVDKPAPIMATALGYPNTTGLPVVDYRIVDSLTDPPGTEDSATERLVRIDPCFLCFRPPESPEPAPVPSLKSGLITFGSFNSLQKLSPAALCVWARLLERVPGSRLALKTGGLENDWARATLLKRLADAGLPQDRVELIPPTKGIMEHLALYSRVDVGLDPFPYNGTTTTCEALWMGVPVVAFAGDRHGARVGVSLLNGVGLPELVGESHDRYIDIAAGLAADRGRLASLRRELRGMVSRSVLCDGPAYARRFETALRAMWQEWCGKQLSSR
jgi:predicted O-linked N-acetylglucosamine transferase (SPINDLY family)